MRLQINKKTGKKVRARVKKHVRIRKKVFGSNEKPRLAVFRSAKHIYAQIIDDSSGATLIQASTLKKSMKAGLGSCEAAKQVGLDLAEKAKGKNIKAVVFDRSGYLYHGRIKALADAAREGGLQF